MVFGGRASTLLRPWVWTDSESRQENAGHAHSVLGMVPQCCSGKFQNEARLARLTKDQEACVAEGAMPFSLGAASRSREGPDLSRGSQGVTPPM